MSSKPVAYLAGGMEKAGEYGKTWRAEITPHLNSLGYGVWNPYMEELNVGVNVEQLAALKHSDYEAFIHYCGRVVDYDLNSLRKCTIVVVRIDESVLAGAGTYGELTLCRYWGIPAHAWIDLPNREYGVPGWAMGCLTTYTTSREVFYGQIPFATDLRHQVNLDYR